MQWMNPMGINAPWVDYLKNIYSQTWKYNKQPHDLTQKMQEVNPMGLCSPWDSYLKTIIHKHENKINKLKM